MCRFSLEGVNKNLILYQKSENKRVPLWRQEVVLLVILTPRHPFADLMVVWRTHVGEVDSCDL
jgi:hypothetical protein